MAKQAFFCGVSFGFFFDICRAISGRRKDDKIVGL